MAERDHSGKTSDESRNRQRNGGCRIHAQAGHHPLSDRMPAADPRLGAAAGSSGTRGICGSTRTEAASAGGASKWVLAVFVAAVFAVSSLLTPRRSVLPGDGSLIGEARRGDILDRDPDRFEDRRRF